MKIKEGFTPSFKKGQKIVLSSLQTVNYTTAVALLEHGQDDILTRTIHNNQLELDRADLHLGSIGKVKDDSGPDGYITVSFGGKDIVLSEDAITPLNYFSFKKLVIPGIFSLNSASGLE